MSLENPNVGGENLEGKILELKGRSQELVCPSLEWLSSLLSFPLISWFHVSVSWHTSCGLYPSLVCNASPYLFASPASLTSCAPTLCPSSAPWARDESSGNDLAHRINFFILGPIALERINILAPVSWTMRVLVHIFGCRSTPSALALPLAIYPTSIAVALSLLIPILLPLLARFVLLNLAALFIVPRFLSALVQSKFPFLIATTLEGGSCLVGCSLHT